MSPGARPFLPVPTYPPGRTRPPQCPFSGRFPFCGDPTPTGWQTSATLGRQNPCDTKTPFSFEHSWVLHFLRLEGVILQRAYQAPRSAQLEICVCRRPPVPRPLVRSTGFCSPRGPNLPHGSFPSVRNHPRPKSVEQPSCAVVRPFVFFFSACFPFF